MTMFSTKTVLKLTSLPKLTLAALLLANLAPMAGSYAQAVKTDGTTSININEDIRKFCGNIADAARDKRYLIQREELHKLQAQVDERISVLKERRDDYKNWLDQRNRFLETAEAGLVEIFKKMKPDAAAKQLEIIDRNISAAIIMKLDARLSSQIFNEMDSEVAAGLATIIASAVDDTLDSETPT